MRRSQLPHNLQVAGSMASPKNVVRPMAISTLHVFDHVLERGPGKEYFVDATAFHDAGVRLGNGATATPEYPNVSGACFTEQGEDFRKKLDMPAVVRRNADGPDIFLDRSANDIASGAVITEINHFDAIADQFDIDGDDGAVMAIANRHYRQDAKRNPGRGGVVEAS